MKSRETLAIFATAGAEVEVVEYLKTPPSRDELARVYAKADMTAQAGLRPVEGEARGLKDAGDDAILDAMAANPILIDRPLVETARGVRLCRLPERVPEIL